MDSDSSMLNSKKTIACLSNEIDFISKVFIKFLDIRAWLQTFEEFYQSPWRDGASLGGGCGHKNTLFSW